VPWQGPDFQPVPVAIEGASVNAVDLPFRGPKSVATFMLSLAHPPFKTEKKVQKNLEGVDFDGHQLFCPLHAVRKQKQGN
jgi:hypothetical protein